MKANPRHPVILDSFLHSPLKTSFSQPPKKRMPKNKQMITAKIKEIIVVPPVLFNSCQAYSSPLSANAGIEMIVSSNNRYNFFIIIDLHFYSYRQLINKEIGLPLLEKNGHNNKKIYICLYYLLISAQQ